MDIEELPLKLIWAYRKKSKVLHWFYLIVDSFDTFLRFYTILKHPVKFGYHSRFNKHEEIKFPPMARSMLQSHRLSIS
ncbi:hypothetical protein EBR21_03470 [bacterium]|nr:hypothetical protein [bacterium]